MNRAEQLRLELQAQQARIAEENRKRTEYLESAYEAIYDLNFLGFSPTQLEGAEIPYSFLKGAYSHYKLPVPEPSNVKAPPLIYAPPIASTPSPVLVQQPTFPTPTPVQPLAKRKTGQTNWDSEWVAPKVEKFGDNRWSTGLKVDLSDSDEDDDDQPTVASQENVSDTNGEDRRIALEVLISSNSVDIKSLENNVNQLSRTLELQSRKLMLKKEALRRKILEQQRTAEKLDHLVQKPKKQKVAADSNPPISCGASNGQLDGSLPNMNMSLTVPMSKPRVTTCDGLEQYGVIDLTSELDNCGAKEDPIVLDDGSTSLPMPDTSEEMTENEIEEQPGTAGIPSGTVDCSDEATEIGSTADMAQNSHTPQDAAINNVVNGNDVTEEQIMQAPPLSSAALHQPHGGISFMSTYRIHPLWVGSNPANAYSHTYNSLFVTSKLATEYLCNDELEGKQCDGCEDLHFRDFNVPTHQILSHILKTQVNSAVRKQFKARLKDLPGATSAGSMELLLELIKASK